MTDRGARRLAWLAFVLYVLLFVAELVLDVLARLRTKHAIGSGGDISFILVTTAFPIVALLILSKQPRNASVGSSWPSASLG